MEIPAIFLFPHMQLSDSALKKVLDCFEQLFICQPWHMEAGILRGQGSDSSTVRLLHPPEGLKPKADFKRLLSEYRLWIKQNQDKRYAVLVKAAQDLAPSEDTTREIRHMIRSMGEDRTVTQENPSLKWHLVLHLAQEIEENRIEAQAALNQLKRQKSPLEGALEERPASGGLFEDLTPFEPSPLMDQHHLRQVFEAWLGLFGQYLRDNGSALLVTFDRNVLDCAADIFEDSGLGPCKEKPVPAALTSCNAYAALKHLPLLPRDRGPDKDPVLAGLSGKTIVLFE